MSLTQGELVLISYPFSDFELSKVRPAIVISNNNFNEISSDCLLVPLTTNLKDEAFTMLINQQDLNNGKLIRSSKIKVGKIFAMNQESILLKLGKVKTDFFNKLKTEIIKIF